MGIVGLGAVGLTAARHILAGGWPVVGYRRGPSDEFQALGGERAGSVREVAERADVLLLALPSAAVLEEVVLGDGGVLDGQTRAGVVVDLGTSALELKARLQQALADRGIGMLDCPTGGPPPPGVPGRLTIALPSGDPADYERCAELLDTFTTKLSYVGPFGAGTAMKFVCNVLVAEHTVATAEAVALGLRAGLDPQLLVEVVGQSPGTSWIWENRAGLMASGSYLPARGTVDMLRKDLAAIADFAEAHGCRLPFLEASAERFEEAADRGLGDHDVAVVFSLLDDEPGSER